MLQPSRLTVVYNALTSNVILLIKVIIVDEND